MIEIVKWAVAVCILMGSLICLVASFGTLRLPDVYTRAHASSKGSTLGVNLVLLGVLGYLWMLTGEISVKILLGIIFILLTAPVGAHLICRPRTIRERRLIKEAFRMITKGSETL